MPKDARHSSGFTEENSATETDTLKRILGILVNWHISTRVYFDEDSSWSLLVKIPVLKCGINLLGFQWLYKTCRLCCRIILSVHSENWISVSFQTEYVIRSYVKRLTIFPLIMKHNPDQVKPNPDCSNIFQIDLEPNGIPFDSVINRK